MNFPNSIRFHSFLFHTRANGPGLRACLWLQGCNLACPGCFNPETHSANKISFSTIPSVVGDIALAVDQFKIEGLTISGGEPFQQLPQLLRIIGEVRALFPSLSIIIFTGYTSREAFDLLSNIEGGVQTILDC